MKLNFELKFDINLPIIENPVTAMPNGFIWRTVLEGDDYVIITINVNSQNPKDIRAFGLEVIFDNEVLDFTEFEKESLTEEWYALGGNEIEPGKLIIGGFMGNPQLFSVDGAGGLFSIKFKFRGAKVPSQIRIQNYIDDIKDMNPSALYVNVGAG